MRKIFIALLACHTLQATPLQTELKLGYFRFSDPLIRKIYNKDALNTQLTISAPVSKFLGYYGGVNYISCSGQSVGELHRTHMMILPVSFGLQARFDIACDIKYYATLGPRYFYTHQKNRFKGIDHSVTGRSLGGFINTGFQIFATPNLFIDLFGEYDYCRIHFHSHRHNVIGKTQQLGGLTAGGGLGYQF